MKPKRLPFFKVGQGLREMVNAGLSLGELSDGEGDDEVGSKVGAEVGIESVPSGRLD
ncbi:MAG: hypothetical protein MUC50_20875 [Myxococcota bacterium]|nr:hypothetical protein [Myxococcota bacterium]